MSDGRSEPQADPARRPAPGTRDRAGQLNSTKVPDLMTQAGLL